MKPVVAMVAVALCGMAFSGAGVLCAAEEGNAELLAAVQQAQADKAGQLAPKFKDDVATIEAVGNVAATAAKEDVRNCALWTLGSMRSAEAAKALVAVFAKLDAGGKQIALCALRDNGNPESVPFLVRCAESQQEELLRREAVDALAKVTGDAGLEALLDLSKDDSPRTVALACYGLGQMEESKAQQRLFEMLEESSSADVRVAVARACAGCPDKQQRQTATKLAASLKKQKDDEVVAAILESLGVIGDASTVGALKSFGKRREGYVRDLCMRTIDMLEGDEPELDKLEDRLAKAKKLLAKAPVIAPPSAPTKDCDDARKASGMVIVALMRYSGVQDRMSDKQRLEWRETLVSACKTYILSFHLPTGGVGYRDGLNMLKAANIALPLVQDGVDKRQLEVSKKAGEDLVKGTVDHKNRRPGQLW